MKTYQVKLSELERQWHVLDAADFGVPQSRRRLFMVCSREDKPFELEVPNKRRRTVR